MDLVQHIRLYSSVKAANRMPASLLAEAIYGEGRLDLEYRGGTADSRRVRHRTRRRLLAACAAIARGRSLAITRSIDLGLVVGKLDAGSAAGIDEEVDELGHRLLARPVAL